METYEIKHICKGDPKFAIAVNTLGKYGILSGFETVKINNGDLEFVECGIVCPFEYDTILYGGECYYNRTDDDSLARTFELFILRVFSTSGRKEGLFSTLYGAIILKPIPTNQYWIIYHATTEGLIGCYKHEKDSGLNQQRIVFLNCEGDEIITLDKRWRNVDRGFQGGEAFISSGGSYQASLDTLGRITNLTKLARTVLEEIDYHDIEEMYRSAFEDDPGAEWNID